MDLVKLQDGLPNGLHDAILKDLKINYSDRILTFSLAIWIGDSDSDNRAEIETYQDATLIIKDFLYCIIDPPNWKEARLDRKDPSLDFDVDSDPPVKKDKLGGASAYTFFVFDWYSYIFFAGKDAEIILGKKWSNYKK